MARQKVENALKSERQVDDALRQIGGLEIEIERIEGEGNEKINAIKQEMAEQSASLVDRLTVLKLQLQAYAEEKYKDGEFDKTRTDKFQFGEISFRRSQKLATVPKTKIEEAIKLLKERGLSQCVRVKAELDKDAIRRLGLGEEQLKACGLMMKKDDTFGYTIYREKIVLPADAGMEESREAKAS